jgi:hypothetical protein
MRRKRTERGAAGSPLGPGMALAASRKRGDSATIRPLDAFATPRVSPSGVLRPLHPGRVRLHAGCAGSAMDVIRPDAGEETAQHVET